MPDFHRLLGLTGGCGKKTVVMGPVEGPNDSGVSLFDPFEEFEATFFLEDEHLTITSAGQ